MSMPKTVDEAYNRIREHFSQPGAALSYDHDNDHCCYRGPNGTKCAVGCLISEDEYDPAFEGLGAYFGSNAANCSGVAVKLWPKISPEVGEFLRSAQIAHDSRAADSGSLEGFLSDLEIIMKRETACS